jgi:hypothetical protein
MRRSSAGPRIWVALYSQLGVSQGPAQTLDMRGAWWEDFGKCHAGMGDPNYAPNVTHYNRTFLDPTLRR